MTRAPLRGRWAALFVVIAMLAASGCTETVKLVPAEGVLLIDGQPAANVSVQFMPDVLKGGKGPTSFGTTDAEGKFTLQTNDGKPGAVAGPHKVVLADLEEERTPQGSTPRKSPRIDSKYTTVKSALEVEVKGDGQPIKLQVPRFRG